MIAKEAAANNTYMQQVCGAWNISPYAYCSLRCVYCCTEAQGRSKPMLSQREIDTLLRVRLRAAQPGHVTLGTVTDIYPEEEAEHRVARALLEMLAEEGVPYTIVTKSDMVLRDLDILKETKSTVRISAGITDEESVELLEPRAPSFERRIEVLSTLSEAGVDVGLNAYPWVPGVSDAEKIIRAVDGRFRVAFGPLILFDFVASMYKQKGLALPTALRSLGKKLTQEEIDLAYLDEAERWLDQPHVAWSPPKGTVDNINLMPEFMMNRDNIGFFREQSLHRHEMPEGRGELPENYRTPIGSGVSCMLKGNTSA